jgi:UMP-CMP kinase
MSAEAMPIPPEPSIPLPTTNKSLVFSPEKVIVVYILGGPGSGKGTQSECLVSSFHFTHLSAGDLLRAEQSRPGSSLGAEIKENIANGQIVRAEVTVKLLENAMREHLSPEGEGRFLIDGFPRKLDQMVIFEEEVCPSKLTLFLDCPEDVMRERLLNRGKTSGRADDNEESIVKRFRTFLNDSMPVVEAQEKEGKVVKVSAVGPEEDVYGNLERELVARGVHPV